MRQRFSIRRINWLIIMSTAATVAIALAACTSGEPQPEEIHQETKEIQGEIEEPSDELKDVEMTVEESEGDLTGDDEAGEVDKEQAYPEPEDSTISRTDRLTPTTQPAKELEKVPAAQETVVIGEVPEEIMGAIMKDLSDRSNAGTEDVQVIRAEYSIWPDGSLGCAKPGEMYTQAQVPGYWVVLEIDGETYDYRASETGYFLLCEQSLPMLPPISEGTPEK